MSFMFTQIRQFFRHYSKLDLLNWFSMILLLVLMLATQAYPLGRFLAWGLLGGALFWLAVLHHEMGETLSAWKKKQVELEQGGLAAKLSSFLKKSELELWGYWSILLFTDWMGLFWGVIALGLSLGKYLLAPLFIISVAGTGASVIYLLLNLYRTTRLPQRTSL